MEVALIIIIGALLVLVAVVSLKGRRAERATRKTEEGEARVIEEKAKAQQELSTARRAEVRAASAERASEAGSATDE